MYARDTGLAHGLWDTEYALSLHVRHAVTMKDRESGASKGGYIAGLRRAHVASYPYALPMCMRYALT